MIVTVSVELHVQNNEEILIRVFQNDIVELDERKRL